MRDSGEDVDGLLVHRLGEVVDGQMQKYSVSDGKFIRDDLFGVSPELEAIAATLGSDIPFFIRNRPAICRGRGETMELAGSVPDANLLLVKPPFPVSTAWAYKAWAADGKPDSTAPTQFLGDIELTNDLEAPVFNKFLLLPAIKSWLIAQPEVSAAMMSGSGSTVFAVLNRTASNLFERIRARFGEHMWTCACRIKAPGGSVAVPSHFSPMNTNQR